MRPVATCSRRVNGDVSGVHVVARPAAGGCVGDVAVAFEQLDFVTSDVGWNQGEQVSCRRLGSACAAWIRLADMGTPANIIQPSRPSGV